MSVEPRRNSLLLVGSSQRIQIWRREFAAQRIQRLELLRRNVLLGQLVNRRQQCLSFGFERINRAAGRRGRIVDLMRKSGSQGAKGDQGAVLPCGRFDRARGAVETRDEVCAKGEPRVGPIAKHLRGDFEHSTLAGSPSCCEIGSVLIPGTKTTSPTPRHVHADRKSVV